MQPYFVVSENPLSDEDDYRIEVLISLRRLERLDKDEYNDDERQEAEEVGEGKTKIAPRTFEEQQVSK